MHFSSLSCTRVEWWAIITSVFLLPSLGPHWVAEPPALWGLVLWEPCSETPEGRLSEGRKVVLNLAWWGLQQAWLSQSTPSSDSAAPPPPLESSLWQVRACADNSTVQCWCVLKGARECSENWGKTCVEPKQDHEKKHLSAFNEYINYSGKQQQRTVL